MGQDQGYVDLDTSFSIFVTDIKVMEIIPKPTQELPNIGYSSNSPTFNEWVDVQREYILSLPLDIRDAIVRWDHNSQQFLDPSKHWMVGLLDIALQDAPPLPMDLLVFKSLRDISFLPSNVEDAIGRTYAYESFYATTVRRSYADAFLEISNYPRMGNYIMEIFVEQDTQCLYIQAYIDDIGELVLPRDCQIHILNIKDGEDGAIILECKTSTCSPIVDRQGIAPMDDDTWYLNNARLWIEWSTALDPDQWNLDRWIDIPVWDQKKIHMPGGTSPQYPSEPVRGAAGSGILIMCNDGTFLSLRRESGLDEPYDGSWDVPGGGTSGENHPIKAHYVYRMYVFHIRRDLKKRLSKQIKIQEDTYDLWKWLPISRSSNIASSFQRYALAWKRSRDENPLHPYLAYALDHAQ